MFFDENIIELKIKANSDKDIITKLARILTQRRIVKSDFLDHVLEREKQFPTGLAIKDGLGIAIPHTDSAYVNKSQIAVATLEKPVTFKDMVDSNKKVKVSVVFMIAMSQPHEQADLLSNLINMCQRPEAVENLINSNSKEAVEKTLREYHLD